MAEAAIEGKEPLASEGSLELFCLCLLVLSVLSGMECVTSFLLQKEIARLCMYRA